MISPGPVPRNSLCRLFLLAGVLFLFPAVAEARYCSNPNCRMCNRIFGPMAGFSTYSVADVYRQPSIDSTPHAVVDAMLDQLDLGPDDILYDLGCGDGRILIAAVKKFGCKAVGIEVDPYVAEIARANVRAAKCGRIRVVTGDATKYYLDQANAVTMYLFPDTMRKLVAKIEAAPIVSYSHPITGRRSSRVVQSDGGPIYVAPLRPLFMRLL